MMPQPEPVGCEEPRPVRPPAAPGATACRRTRTDVRARGPRRCRTESAPGLVALASGGLRSPPALTLAGVLVALLQAAALGVWGPSLMQLIALCFPLVSHPGTQMPGTQGPTTCRRSRLPCPWPLHILTASWS
jgi:hypothetical protein